jgi:hypothetical protein
LQLWRPITLCADLWLKWGLKQSYNPCWFISKGMWHITYTQGNEGDSRLLVVESQIDNLTPDPSFGHNLCFKYSNGSCKPILNIYISRPFQWYKELFNPMNFDPCNCLWKFENPSRLQFPKWEPTWECMGSFLHTFPTFMGTWNVTPRLHSWPAPLQALALVVSSRLGLRHYNTHKMLYLQSKGSWF